LPCTLRIGKKFLTRFLSLCLVLIFSTTASVLNPTEVQGNPGPDLVVQNITLSPAEPALGNVLTITVAVKNQGTSEAGNSYVACQIDDIILNSGNIGTINAGMTRTVVFHWTVQSGSHIIKATADASDVVAEDNETNNIKTYSFTALAADLIVESISWTPESPSKGDDVVISITVKNQGNYPSAPSTVHLYTDDICRGYLDVAILDPGETSTKTFNWMAPAGQCVIKGVVDEADNVQEDNENNNEKYLTLSTVPPDLTIQDITWTPQNPSKNDVVTFTITVKNQGSGRAESCHLGYYINGEYNSVVKIGALEANDSIDVNYNYTLISEEFEFKTIIDLYNDVAESEEENNQKKAYVVSTAPDLTITGISWTPANAAIGDTLTFSVAVKNQGAGNAASSHLSYEIGNRHSGYVAVPALAAGATATVTFQSKTQLDMLALTVRVSADYDNKIAETVEYNNIQSKTISLSLPDLAITSITWSPENLTIDETVTFDVTIENQGTGKVGIFQVAYYMDGILLKTDSVYTAEMSTTVHKTCTWEPQTGIHIFKAIADSNKLITESNENNNEVSAKIVPNTPDLYVNNVTWSPISWQAGEEVIFTTSVKNQGGVASIPCRLNCEIDGIEIGYQEIDQIEPGATVTKDFLWISTEGSHRIELVIDTNNTVIEFDEVNNTRVVLLPPPDLILQDIAWTPTDAGIGDNVTFSAKVINQGSGKALEPKLTFYVDDIVVGVVDLPEMGTGNTASGECKWTIEAAKHDVRIYVDAADMITESDETNNEELIVFAPQSPDLILEKVSWAMENALIDNEVTFTIVVKNQGSFAAEASQLDFYVDDTLLESENIEPLEPGETATITFIITVEAGLHSSKIVVDPGELVVESSEENNEKIVPFSTLAPDLTVKSINLTPAIANIGDTVTVTVKLENRGRSAAVNTNLDLQVNGSSLGVMDIESIDVGQIITRDYTWIVEEGPCEFSAWVDLDEMILENNEDNNVFSKTMTFTTPVETTDNQTVQIPSTGEENKGLLASSWLIIIAAAALLGGLSFLIAYKSFKKE
jgi:subtilase family serine protease